MVCLISIKDDDRIHYKHMVYGGTDDRVIEYLNGGIGCEGNGGDAWWLPNQLSLRFMSSGSPMPQLPGGHSYIPEPVAPQRPETVAMGVTDGCCLFWSSCHLIPYCYPLLPSPPASSTPTHIQFASHYG